MHQPLLDALVLKLAEVIGMFQLSHTLLRVDGKFSKRQYEGIIMTKASVVK